MSWPINVYAKMFSFDRLSSFQDLFDLFRYEWMMACWRKNPSDRPNFYQIISFIERYMETLPKTPQPEDLFPNDEQLWALNGDSA